MLNSADFRHFGGGRKGIFLVLRYVFITVAAYLLVFQNPHGGIATMQGVMVVAALASNVALSAMSSQLLFAWYVEAPILIADTLWVSWAIHSTGAIGQEFFLLYFFVLFLAATSNSLPMVVFGASFISLVDVYLSAGGDVFTTPHLLRIVFFFSVALFYGQVLNEIKRERQRADRGFAWAREIEAKVNRRTTALQRMYLDLLIASRGRAERTASACRDLRVQLQSIQEDTKHLLESGGAAESAGSGQIFASIRDASAALLHVVSTLEGVATADDTRSHVAWQPVRVDNLFADAQRRERPTLRSQVEVQWKSERDLPTIESDPMRLTLVLESLIDNAIKFTSKGTIAVYVRDLRSRRQIELRVDDSGIGMDERDVPRLLHPFRALEEKGDPNARIGVGLALVERLVEQLGGELTVRSTLGRGSSLVVRVPYAPAHEAAPAAEEGKAVEEMKAAGEPGETAELEMGLEPDGVTDRPQPARVAPPFLSHPG